MAITGYGSSILSLAAQRRLGIADACLASNLQRLASGQRINNPSDDAAGLAVSSSLNAASRIFGQGVRNLYDGISLVNVADGALREQSTLLQRLEELATQAANGTFSLSQRRSLNDEARALTDEFNRAVATAQFNGLPLLRGDLSRLRLHGGNHYLDVNIGGELTRAVGSGQFNNSVVINMGIGNVYAVKEGDLNGDGKLDLVTTGENPTAARVYVMMGNGDGTMGAAQTYAIGVGAVSVANDAVLADVNKDGRLDIVTVGKNDGNWAEINVLLNPGNGDFSGATRLSYNIDASTMKSIALADLNGDGWLDVVTGGYNSANHAQVTVVFGQNGGTFSTSGVITYEISTSGTLGKVLNLKLADVNGDNKLDIVTGGENASGAAELNVLLGYGTGSFADRTSYTIGSGANSVINAIAIGDLDGNGTLDIVTGGDNDSSQAEVNVLLGHGNGSFGARVSYLYGTSTMGDIYGIRLVDLDENGILDIVTAGNPSIDMIMANEFSVMLGQGDGTFAARVSYAGGASGTFAPAIGDFDGDGALDLAGFGSGWIQFVGAIATQTTTFQRLNLCTREGALSALDVIKEAQERVRSELASLGAIVKRLEVASSNLSSMRENYLSASSRITDVDVAQESSELARNQILRQTAAAILGQANLVPQLALKLLRT